MKLLVIVGVDIPTRKHLFDVGQKPGIYSHHIFNVAVDGTILNHPDLIVPLDDLRLNLTNLLINKNRNVFLATEY